MRYLGLVLAGAVAGAAIWWATLSWGEGTSRYPAQVAVAALAIVAVGVAARVRAGERYIMAPPIGLTLGFCTAWTAHAAATDETGLFLVGTVLLGLGMLAGTAVLEWVTLLVMRRR